MLAMKTGVSIESVENGNLPGSALLTGKSENHFQKSSIVKLKSSLSNNLANNNNEVTEKVSSMMTMMSLQASDMKVSASSLDLFLLLFGC